MNHYLATYIDLIQSIGIISIWAVVIFSLRKLYLDNKKDLDIDLVKIRIDE